MKSKYIELVPRKHTKTFESKSEAWNYWEKRFIKFSDNTFPENPKDFFDARVITLNRDGTPRKIYEAKPLTKKAHQARIKGHQIWMKKMKEETRLRNIKRLKIEDDLNLFLEEQGFRGKVHIKGFRDI